MATERLPMRKIREILRLKWTEGRRHRQIARALGVGVGTVSDVVRAGAAAGLEWAQVAALGEAELEAALYRSPRRALRTPLPDPAAMDVELKKPGVTLRCCTSSTASATPTATATNSSATTSGAGSAPSAW